MYSAMDPNDEVNDNSETIPEAHRIRENHSDSDEEVETQLVSNATTEDYADALVEIMEESRRILTILPELEFMSDEYQAYRVNL